VPAPLIYGEKKRRLVARKGALAVDPKNRKAIPHRLRQCGYARVRNEYRADGYWLIGKERRVIYAKYDLSLREQFAAAEALVEREEKIAKFMG
jgi:hypothetical protein